MNKVLVLSKGTGQAKAFERVAVAHTEKNNIQIEWVFALGTEMEEVLSNKEISVAIIAPELMLVEKKIKEELDSIKVPYITLKPVDFGLKNMAKIMPQIEPYLK